MKKLLILIPVIIIAAVAYKSMHMQKTQPENGYIFSGTVETTEVRLSFKTSGKIKKIFFDEGDRIVQGDLAAELDNTDELLNISASEANLDYSNAVLSEVLAGSRKQEIKNAKAGLDIAKASMKKAEAELSQAESDEKRFKTLYSQNGISKRSYELYKTAYEKALQTYEESKGAVQKAEETLSLAIEGSRNEAVAKAKAMVSISEKALDQAKQKLEYTKLHSPVSGTVLTKSAENGEFVQPGSTILTAADTENVWIRGYVSGEYLGKIHIGQKVTVSSDSYPDKNYEGKITYISDKAEFTPKSVQTYEERINYMYRIKADVDNSSQELKSGMPVTGRIDFGG